MVDSDENDKFDLGVKGLFVLLICLTSLPSVLLTMPIAIGPLTSKSDLHVYNTHNLKSLVVPVIWWALIGAIYSRIAPFFALNHIFFPANEQATLKTK